MCVRTEPEVLTEEQVVEMKRQKFVLKMKNLAKKKSFQVEPKNNSNNKEVLEFDALAVVTAQQKKLLEIFNEKYEEFKKTRVYKVLFGTTQPAHFIVLFAVIIVASVFIPSSTTKTPSSFASLFYLAAFSMHFGAQFWMTFISGLALYFNLPRHAFGEVQKVLFPIYFTLNSILSLTTLVAFTHLNDSTSLGWHFNRVIQACVLSICFLLELTIRLYVVPPVLKLITAKSKIEDEAGVGQEVGHHNPGPLKHCPHYIQLHSQFRRMHMIVAIGNITTIACSSFHLHYIAYNWLCQPV